MEQKQTLSETVKIRVTEEEKQKIREIARKQRRSMSSYGRAKLLEPIDEVEA